MYGNAHSHYCCLFQTAQNLGAFPKFRKKRSGKYTCFRPRYFVVLIMILCFSILPHTYVDWLQFSHSYSPLLYLDHLWKLRHRTLPANFPLIPHTFLSLWNYARHWYNNACRCCSEKWRFTAMKRRRFVWQVDMRRIARSIRQLSKEIHAANAWFPSFVIWLEKQKG